MTTPTSSTALTKRSTSQSLMAPPPPPKRIKRPTTVLDEDIYTNALSEIIARDYFPGLLETQVKQEYLEALESGDRAWIESSRRKLVGLMGDGLDDQKGWRERAGSARGATPREKMRGGKAGDTPAGWGGETPMSVVSGTTARTTEEEEEREKKDIPDVSNMSLQTFQSKYTSEDNESFNKLLDRQNTKHREKYAWLWNSNKIPSARQIAHHKEETKRITAKGEHPERAVAIKTDLDARPAKPDAWDANPQNSLMFRPDSIEDEYETIAQKAEAVSRAGPKRVVHRNTRLPDPDIAAAQAQSVPPSPSISAIQDAIAGRPRPTESEAAYTGGETPRVNGYAFVDDEPDPEHEPSPSPSQPSLLLSSGDKTPNPFNIAANRRREDLHHRMVDRVAHTKRVEKASREIRSPVPNFPSSPRLDLGLRTPGAKVAGGQKMLTPAAQKLLKRVGSTPTPREGGSEGSGLRNMWTPTPRRR